MEKEEITTNDYLKGIVLNLPDSPGIYQYLNSEGTIIYVGKAKNLKRRVSSYFNREHPNGKTRADDNHAPPVSTVPKKRTHYCPVSGMSRLGKVLRVASN